MKKIKYLLFLLIIVISVLTTSTAQVASIDPISIDPPDSYPGPIEPYLLAKIETINNPKPGGPGTRCVMCGGDCYVLNCGPR